MRTHLRIDPFLQKVDIPLLVTLLLDTDSNYSPGKPEESLYYIDVISDGVKKNAEHWKENPDLRFGQMMFNAGFSLFEKIYHKEEYEILMMCGYKDVESFGWVSVLNADGELIEPVFRYICDLNTDHLRKMIAEANEGTRAYPFKHLELFEKELMSRSIPDRLTDEGKLNQYELYALNIHRFL